MQVWSRNFETIFDDIGFIHVSKSLLTVSCSHLLSNHLWWWAFSLVLGSVIFVDLKSESGPKYFLSRWYAGDDPVKRAGKTVRENHQVPRDSDSSCLKTSSQQEHCALWSETWKCSPLIWFRLPSGQKNVLNYANKNISYALNSLSKEQAMINLMVKFHFWAKW